MVLQRCATAVVQNVKASRSRFLMVILRRKKKEIQTNGFILSFSLTVLSFQRPSLS